MNARIRGFQAEWSMLFTSRLWFSCCGWSEYFVTCVASGKCLISPSVIFIVNDFFVSGVYTTLYYLRTCWCVFGTMQLKLNRYAEHTRQKQPYPKTHAPSNSHTTSLISTQQGFTVPSSSVRQLKGSLSGPDPITVEADTVMRYWVHFSSRCSNTCSSAAGTVASSTGSPSSLAPSDRPTTW